MTETRTTAANATSLLGLIAMLVLVAGVVAARMNGLIDGDDATRWVGAVFSVLMIGAGNLLPKRAARGAASVKGSRAAGWLLVLGGVLSLGLWIWAPADIRVLGASATALTLFALAVLAALGHLRRNDAPGRTSGGQQAILHILHGLMWAFAIFAAQVLAGKDGALWAAAGFGVSLALLQLCLLPVRRAA